MSLIAFSDETLRKHLEDVAKEISTRFLPKRAELVVGLLKPSDVNLESARCAMLCTGIFHDVGKAYEPFQEMLRKEGIAPRHEIFSVYFSDKVLNKKKGDLRTIVLLAIAWHHSATRGVILERIRGTTSKYLKVDSVRLNGHSREMLSEILGDLLSKFGCEEEADLSEIPEVITVDDAGNLLDELGRCIRKEESGSYRIYPAVLPLLTALQIADAKVASENRKEGIPPVHLRDITNLNAKGRVARILMGLR